MWFKVADVHQRRGNKPVICVTVRCGLPWRLQDGRDLKCLMSAANSTYQTAAAYSNIEVIISDYIIIFLNGQISVLLRGFTRIAINFLCG